MNRLSLRHAEQPFCGFFFMSAQAAFEAGFIFSRHHNILSDLNVCVETPIRSHNPRPKDVNV